MSRESSGAGKKVQLMGSGAILREVIAGAELLEQEFKVSADIWSATSFTELRRDGEAVERARRLNPGDEAISWVEKCLSGREGPVVAATDYVTSFAGQIRAYLPQDEFIVLGTDGFGRSDTRENLRRHFEVDRQHVAYAALYGLYLQGELGKKELLGARQRLGIEPDAADPATA